MTSEMWLALLNLILLNMQIWIQSHQQVNLIKDLSLSARIKLQNGYRQPTIRIYLHQYPLRLKGRLLWKTTSAGKRLFILFFDNEVYDLIIEHSTKYAHDNNFPLISALLKRFLGILILTGYHTQSQM